MDHATIEFLVSQGSRAHQAGALTQAISHYNKALKINPTNGHVLYLMSLAQQQTGQHDRALNFLSRAIKLQPDDAKLHFHLGVSLTQKNRFLDAIDAYKTALTYQNDYFEAYFYLGNTLAKSNQRQKAIEAFLSSLKLNPSSSVAHFNLGVNYHESLRPAEAINHYKEAIKLNPNYSAALCNLSVALCEIGRVQEAIVTNAKAIEINPNLADAHFNSHTFLVSSGKLNEAIFSIEKANKLEPHNEKFKFFLGMLLDYTGNHQKADLLLKTKKASRAWIADIESWHYIKQLSPRPIMLGSSHDVFNYAMDKAFLDGLVLEFGVFHGTSIRQLASLVHSTVHGFDSFEGIPENWNAEKAGSYSTQGLLPIVPNNVLLHQGWFDQTLPGFIEQNNQAAKFINIDCDLYSSTKTVLDLLHKQIVPGTVIVFDEFIAYPSWKEDEFQAFNEAADQYGWAFEVLCFCFVTKQVAIQIKSSEM